MRRIFHPFSNLLLIPADVLQWCVARWVIPFIKPQNSSFCNPGYFKSFRYPPPSEYRWQQRLYNSVECCYLSINSTNPWLESGNLHSRVANDETSQGRMNLCNIERKHILTVINLTVTHQHNPTTLMLCTEEVYSTSVKDTSLIAGQNYHVLCQLCEWLTINQ